MYPQKTWFWHQHTKTSQFDDYPLFTIQNLCFHGAKATKISIFWNPQSCQAVMLMLTSLSSYVAPAMSLKLCHSRWCWCQWFHKSMIWGSHRAQYPPFTLVGIWDYKTWFWYQKSKTSPYDDNPLFTIQNLCFHGAKATKISIFWYPQSCQAVMLMLTSHSSYVTPAMSLKLCHSPLLLMPMIP